MRAYSGELKLSQLFWSILVPWHNDFIAIWLYIGFFFFFFVSLFMIMCHASLYKMKYHEDYDYLFISAFGATTSLAISVVYLVLYPKSDALNQFLSNLDYIGKLVFTFFFTFAFVGSELVGSSFYFPFLFFMVFVLALNLILV